MHNRSGAPYAFVVRLLCTTRVKVVEAVVKGLWVAHNLCAGAGGKIEGSGITRSYTPIRTQEYIPHLSTPKESDLSLLGRMLYPLSTHPIIMTICIYK